MRKRKLSKPTALHLHHRIALLDYPLATLAKDPPYRPPGKVEAERSHNVHPVRVYATHCLLRSTILRMPSALPPALVPDHYSTLATSARERDSSLGPRRPARRHSRGRARAFVAPSAGKFAIRP